MDVQKHKILQFPKHIPEQKTTTRPLHSVGVMHEQTMICDNPHCGLSPGRLPANRASVLPLRLWLGFVSAAWGPEQAVWATLLLELQNVPQCVTADNCKPPLAKLQTFFGISFFFFDIIPPIR